MEEEKTKKERTVIHLYLKEKDEHLYFGSVANVFEHFTKNDIGITFGSLRNYGLSASNLYENKKVIIRKGILLAKPKKSNKIDNEFMPTDIEVAGKKQSQQIEGNKQKSNVGPQKRIKFGQVRFESYLSNDEIFSFSHYSGMGYSAKRHPEYKRLVNYIYQWCMTGGKSNNKGYATHIYQTLTEICGNNKEKYNDYINKINAKVRNYNLALENYKEQTP